MEVHLKLIPESSESCHPDVQLPQVIECVFSYRK